MRIKEAAERSGLTEKAIRLYEEKGLITPAITEIGERKFRDYDEATVAKLTTIAGLRRSFFSMEQIAAMQENPARIPEIFTEYRDELKEQYDRLALLIGKADEILAAAAALEANEETGRITPEPLRDAASLSKAMTAVTPVTMEKEREIPHYVGKREEPRVHFKRWDEEISSDQRDAVYQQYLAYYAKWEKRYGAELVLWNAVDWCKGHKKIFFGVLGAMLALVLAFNVKIRLPYQIEMDGYMLCYEGHVDYLSDNPPVETEPVTLKLHGKKTYQLFHSPIFTGTVTLDDYKPWQHWLTQNRWITAPAAEFTFSVAGLLDRQNPYYVYSYMRWGANNRLELRDTEGRVIQQVFTLHGEDGFCFHGEKDEDFDRPIYYVFPAVSAEEAETLFREKYLRAWYDEWMSWEAEYAES